MSDIALYYPWTPSTACPPCTRRSPFKQWSPPASLTSPWTRLSTRRTLAAEFDAFREHLASLNDRFSELTQTEDPAILRARLEDLVEADLARPLAELERGLRHLRWEPVRAVLGRSSLALPVVFDLLPETAQLPVVAGAAGMVAATVIGSGARVREEARARRRSAAGYMLGLREELNPTGVVDRMRRVFRHASTYGTP